MTKGTARQDKIRLVKAMKERLLRESRSDLLRFTMATMPTFRPADFHRRYYDILSRFAHKEIKKLMVFMPPQHGKSEGSTRRLPAFIEGLNPDTRLAVVSYSATKAKKFNREIQRIMDTPEYVDIFPDTRLGMSQVGEDSGKGYIRTTEEFEIVGKRGSVKTVGVGGALTGEPVDVLVMDDIYKDAKTAWSPVIRESVSDWYDTVAETRLHNDSQQLIVFTRWHEDDLAGTLLRQQGEYDPEKIRMGGLFVFTRLSRKVRQQTMTQDKKAKRYGKNGIRFISCNKSGSAIRKFSNRYISKIRSHPKA